MVIRESRDAEQELQWMAPLAGTMAEPRKQERGQGVRRAPILRRESLIGDYDRADDHDRSLAAVAGSLSWGGSSCPSVFRCFARLAKEWAHRSGSRDGVVAWLEVWASSAQA